LREYLWSEISDFKRDVFPFFMLDEVKANYPITWVNNLEKQMDFYGEKPFFFVIKDSTDEIIATFVKTINMHIYLPNFEYSIIYRELILMKLFDYVCSHYSYQFFNGIIGDKDHLQVFSEYWTQYLEKLNVGLKFTAKQTNRILSLTPDRLLSQFIVGRSEITRLATLNDIDLVSNWLYKFGIDIDIIRLEKDCVKVATRIITDQNFFLLEHQNRIVSMACVGGTTEHGGRISSVYTPSEYRGKGYCTINMVNLCNILFNERGYTYLCLAADSFNPISNKIYEKIGFSLLFDQNIVEITYENK